MTLSGVILVDVQPAHLPHDRDELIVQDLEHVVHAGLAERGRSQRQPGITMGNSTIIPIRAII